MNDPESCNTIAAGSNVTSGATTERKTNSKRTMMNRIVNNWVRFPAAFDCCC